MARSLDALEELGKQVSSSLDELAPERARAIDEARQAFLHTEGTPRARGWFLRVRWVWPLGAALAVTAAALLLLSQRPAPLTFDVEGTPGTAKTWLAAPKASALRLGFSDGSKVRLEARSRARVQDVDPTGATLGLESGSLHAEVLHKPTSAWKVVAGPFTVNVTGTVFDVNWDPNAQELAVSVLHGSVLVGDSTTGVAQAVRTSETLRATTFERRFVVTTANDVASPSSSESSGHATPEDASPKTETPDASPAETSDESGSAQRLPGKRESSASDWRAFAKRGALREAFASAEAGGFEQACASASPSELLLLGDGARLSGNAERATFALLTLRRRFPADSRRAAAAFSLGKVAFDQRRAYEQAARWFSTALREQPTGPLAREASGRLLEALRGAHDATGAQLAAREYLSKYPDGPQAELARSLLH